jgi:hypothetical protein
MLRRFISIANESSSVFCNSYLNNSFLPHKYLHVGIKIVNSGFKKYGLCGYCVIFMNKENAFINTKNKSLIQ